MVATPEARAIVRSAAIAFCERYYAFNAHAHGWAWSAPDSHTLSRAICDRAMDCPVYVKACVGTGRDCDILAHIWYRAVIDWCATFGAR